MTGAIICGSEGKKRSDNYIFASEYMVKIKTFFFLDKSRKMTKENGHLIQRFPELVTPINSTKTEMTELRSSDPKLYYKSFGYKSCEVETGKLLTIVVYLNNDSSSSTNCLEQAGAN